MARPFDGVISAWIDVAARNRGSSRFRVSLSAFESILAGQAPSNEEIAASSGLDLGETDSLVEQLRAEGRLTVDEDLARVTGAGGLSLVESRHTVDMLDRRFWVWCALDAVGIPAGLGVDARVISQTADDGAPVEIFIRKGLLVTSAPDPLCISMVPPALDQSLHDSCCSRIQFYRAPEHIPADATPASIDEIMELGRVLWHEGVPL